MRLVNKITPEIIQDLWYDIIHIGYQRPRVQKRMRLEELSRRLEEIKTKYAKDVDYVPPLDALTKSLSSIQLTSLYKDLKIFQEDVRKNSQQ